MTADPDQVRALSWNVHGFVGRAGVRDPAAVVRAVQQFDADIVALQEIDERGAAGPGLPGFVELREVFGLHGAEARTIRSADGDYGHALMSRWPMTDTGCLDLSVRRREPRLAISARIEAPGGAIRVLAAHLGLSARERRHQIGVIRRHLDAVEEQAVIVMGDFNDWRRVGAASRALCPPFAVAAAHSSYPAFYPVLPLDRIWSRAPLRPIAGGAEHSFRHLSDHLPVFADLAFAADG